MSPRSEQNTTLRSTHGMRGVWAVGFFTTTCGRVHVISCGTEVARSEQCVERQDLDVLFPSARSGGIPPWGAAELVAFLPMRGRCDRCGWSSTNSPIRRRSFPLPGRCTAGVGSLSRSDLSSRDWMVQWRGCHSTNSPGCSHCGKGVAAGMNGLRHEAGHIPFMQAGVFPFMRRRCSGYARFMTRNWERTQPAGAMSRPSVCFLFSECVLPFRDGDAAD